MDYIYLKIIFPLYIKLTQNMHLSENTRVWFMNEAIKRTKRYCKK